MESSTSLSVSCARNEGARRNEAMSRETKARNLEFMANKLATRLPCRNLALHEGQSPCEPPGVVMTSRDSALHNRPSNRRILDPTSVSGIEGTSLWKNRGERAHQPTFCRCVFSDACCERLLSSSIEERTKVRSRRSDAFIRTNGPTYEEENPSPCLSLLERERQNHPAAAAKQIFCRLARKENRHGTCRYAR